MILKNIMILGVSRTPARGDLSQVKDVAQAFAQSGFPSWRGAMARYTITTDDDDMLVEGDFSEGLTCPKAARLAALAALPDMARDKIPDGDCRTFKTAVRDENGQEIYSATMTLAGAWKKGQPS
jgi:hypothetical protein